MYGNPHETHRKKVLLLGDSFTHAVRVSNDKTYYALLQKALDIEVFALAAEGYGTLQEYMMLDKFIDEIQPDLVVLQLCNNDLINNSYDLELESGSNNNGLRRPYFKNNEIMYRTPSNFAAIREFAANYSHFLYFIISRIDIVTANPADPSEAVIRKAGKGYPLFAESVETTDQLLKKSGNVFRQAHLYWLSITRALFRIMTNSGGYRKKMEFYLLPAPQKPWRMPSVKEVS